MSRLKQLLVLLFFFPAFMQGQSTHLAQPKPLVFLHVTVIDVTGAPPQPDRTVIVKDGRIISIAKNGMTTIPAGADVVDASNHYLMPGLWDMHVHLAFENWEPFIRTVFFPLLVANGVTGVRDMAGNMDVLIDLRRRVSSGEILGPRLVIAGRELNWLPQDSGQLAILHPAEGRHAVAKLAAARVDFIKVQDQLSRDVYFAVADEARRLKIPFVGHVPYSVTATEASAAGQKSFEHLIGLPEACSLKEHELKQKEFQAMVRLDPNEVEAENAWFSAPTTYSEKNAARLFTVLKRNHTWQVPTLVEERSQWTISGAQRLDDDRLRYMPEVVLQFWDSNLKNLTKDRTAAGFAAGKKYFENDLALVRSMHHAGIGFLTGTDAIAQSYVFPGFSVHEELELLVTAGLTPLEALQTATRNPAEFLGLLDSLGTVENGKIADMVLLEANPLDDIRNTRRIVGVVLHGRYLPKSEIQNMLSSAEVAASDTRK